MLPSYLEAKASVKSGILDLIQAQRIIGPVVASNRRPLSLLRKMCPNVMIGQIVQRRGSVGRRVRDLPLEVARPGNGSDAVVLEHLHIVVDSSAPEVD